MKYLETLSPSLHVYKHDTVKYLPEPRLTVSSETTGTWLDFPQDPITLFAISVLFYSLLQQPISDLIR